MPKRPRDTIENAIHVARIATGEIKGESKDPAAVALGRKGGQARAKALTSEQRTEIANKAIKARWDKKK